MNLPLPNFTLEPGKKLLGKTGLKVRVALASGVILLIGGLLTPRAAPTALSVPEERAAPLIDAQVLQRRGATQPLRGLEDVAATTSRYGVTIPSALATSPVSVGDYATSDADVVLPAGLGVLVAQQGYVLTHEAALAGRESLSVETATAGPVEAQLVAHEPSTGLALLQIPVRATPALPEFSPRVETGALVVATGQWGANPIALPAFIASSGPRTYLLSIPGDALPPGAPIYNGDGQLVAVAAGDGAVRLAFPADEAVARLVARVATGRGRAPSIGVTLQAVQDFPGAAFGEAGALVTAVVPGGPADLAGVEPGDVVLEIGATPVSTVDAALAAIGDLPIGAESVLRVVRDGRSHTRATTVSSAFAVGVLARGAPQPARSSGVEAQAVFEVTRLHAAGVTPTARVLAINRQTVTTEAQARRAVSRNGDRPLILYVRQGTEHAFVVLPAGEPTP